MAKRNVMNLLLVGALGLPGTTLLGGFAYYFVPPSSGGGGSGQAAKDAPESDIKQAAWVKDHLPGDYTLSQGLKGDATYLMVDAGGKIRDFGINAVCTHLGCVVPWNKAENKFKCRVPRLPIQRRRYGYPWPGAVVFGFSACEHRRFRHRRLQPLD